MMQSSVNIAQRQEFCVRWNSHLGSIGAAFPQLLAGQRFVDVTLACEGSQIHCHRLVLAACSSYFESILAENPCKHPVIILPSEIKLWEIQALVDFMYKGEVNVTQAGLPQLLRCAEQLRIRGLYGSDAALNLNQLKTLTSKNNAAPSTTIPSGGNRIDSGGGGSGGGDIVGVGSVNVVSSVGNIINQDTTMDTDENTNNSTTTTNTTTTTTTPSVLQHPQQTNMLQQQQQLQQQQLQQQQQQQQQQQLQPQHLPPMIQIKKEPLPMSQTNGTLQQHQQLVLQQQLLQQQMKQEAHLAATIMTSMQQGGASNANSNVVTEDDDESGDDSNSNPFEKYAMPATKHLQQPQQTQQQQQIQLQQQRQQHQQQQHLHDSIIEDDHNYVATHDEDDSFNTTTEMDTEHESSANSSLLVAIDSSSASYKRVRRSEASLAQAAKCVSKGQTFQTVSNMFNIPVSTIRFYMARKGILPKRKRGRGASTGNITGAPISGPTVGVVTSLNNSVAMAQTLNNLKRSDSPETTAAYHLMNYKQLNEQGALI